MLNYFIRKDDEILPIIGGVTLSTGDGLEVSQRYGYDYSKTPQSLTYRRRNTALTASLQLAFNNKQCLDAKYGMMDYISELEEVCGERVTLVWNGVTFGDFVITQLQISSQVDPMVIFPQVSVSIALTEGWVRRSTIYSGVGTLRKANSK